MKIFIHLLIAISVITAPVAASSFKSSSIRASDGRLIRKGDTKAEVLRSLGQPDDKQVDSLGVNTGSSSGVTRETWTYHINNIIYTLTFSGNNVERVDWDR